MDPIKRRTFLATGAGLTSGLAATTFAAAPSEQIRVAVLGVNGRGKSHIEGFERLPDSAVVVLCDPDQKVLADRAKAFEAKYKRKVETETDLRRVLERKDVDAVSIATPNHWHALATVWACQAGKDVYVEKPGSHTFAEGRKMIEAASKYKRIVQHGVQLRSSEAVQEGVQKLREGVIGRVYMARGLVFKWRPSVGKSPDEPAPKHLDWNLWQGPASERSFSRRYVHYNWHWHWDYGNGDVGNQGIHEADLCLWGLGVGLPTEIVSTGGRYLWDDDKETPEVLTTVYQYPAERKTIQFEVRPWCTNAEDGVGVGNLFYGSEGYMVIRGYDNYATFLGKNRTPGPKRSGGGDHFANFIKCVRSRNAAELNGPVETAHTSSGLAHLGNIAFRLGRKLAFDPKTETFPNDSEATALLTRPYRKPFEMPETV